MEVKRFIILMARVLLIVPVLKLLQTPKRIPKEINKQARYLTYPSLKNQKETTSEVIQTKTTSPKRINPS